MKFYADQTASVCRQDCSQGDGLPCGGSPTDLSLTLYSSLEACCTTSIPWEPGCVDKSNGVEPQGTGLYYVSWTYSQCGLDCPLNSAPGCVGVAPSWDTKHTTASACCSTINWQPDCIFGATTTTTTTTPVTTTSTTASTTTTTTTPGPALTGWYVDEDKCTLGQSTTQTLHTSAGSCCSTHLSWMSSELCVSRSTGVPTLKFYADQIAGVCRQDCSQGDGLPCGGSPTDLSSTLYSSLEACCTTSISWEPGCVDKSNGVEPQGTGLYYVNWTYGKCVRDCPHGSAPGCGGVKASWDTPHANAELCCATISWEPDCVLT